MLLIFLFFLLALIVERLIKYIRNEKRGWKFRKESYKKIIYKEKIDKVWKEIEIEARIDIGTFVPCFKSEEEWENYPNWAHHRDIIINRIEKKFPPKDDISKIGMKPK